MRVFFSKFCLSFSGFCLSFEFFSKCPKKADLSLYFLLGQEEALFGTLVFHDYHSTSRFTVLRSGGQSAALRASYGPLAATAAVPTQHLVRSDGSLGLITGLTTSSIFQF